MTWRKRLNLSITIAALEAAFWGTALVKVMLDQGAGEAWRLVWLPLLPAAWVAAAVMVIDGLDKLHLQIFALKRAQYALKRA